MVSGLSDGTSTTDRKIFEGFGRFLCDDTLFGRRIRFVARVWINFSLRFLCSFGSSPFNKRDFQSIKPINRERFLNNFSNGRPREDNFTLGNIQRRKKDLVSCFYSKFNRHPYFDFNYPFASRRGIVCLNCRRRCSKIDRRRVQFHRLTTTSFNMNE